MEATIAKNSPLPTGAPDYGGRRGSVAERRVQVASHEGFAVIEAGDWTAALEEVRARADDLDVIVLDVMLPGIPTWEVLREARRLRPGIKIILMSAYSRDYVRQYFEEASIDGFLEKPFVQADVLEVLRETLGKDD